MSARPHRLALLAIGVGEPSEIVQLANACVAAALDKAFGSALDIALVEAANSADGKTVAAEILRSEPDSIGLSVYTWNRARMGEVVDALREIGFTGWVFAGGPETTADPFGLAEDLGLDFAVAGEGEEAVVDVYRILMKESGRGGDREGLRQLLWDVSGIAVPGHERDFSKRRAPLPAKLPSPWLGGRATPEGRDEIVWELSRGCAFNCAYCFESRGEGGVRAFPRDRIEAELDLIVKKGARRVFVLDPTFNWKKDRALDLLGLFAAKGGGLTWKFEVRAELLDKALARAFARLDTSIQIGLQSARPEVLDLVGRPGFDPERFAEKIGLLDAEGVTWGLDLIFGLPGDDLRGFRKSLDYALRLAPNHLDVFPLAVLPGTELGERARELGLNCQPKAPHLLLESPTFSSGDMAKAAEIASACDVFYTKGRAVSWFLRVLAPLKARPSTFLGRFAAWLASAKAIEPEAVAESAIEGLQLAFLEAEFAEGGLSALFPLVGDIVRFEGAWGRAVAEAATTTLELSHEAALIVEPPTQDIRDLARLAKRRDSRVRVGPGRNGPKITIIR